MELNFKELTNQGFPYCAKCGGVLYWQNDETAKEMNYHIDDNVASEQQTVNILSCGKCGHTYHVYNDQVLNDFPQIEDN